MKAIDANGDRVLSESELGEAAPGLKTSFAELDSNGDRQLSESELLSRFEAYASSTQPTRGFECQVLYRGAPLAGGTVRIIPESFFTEGLATASGTVDQNGNCVLRSDVDEQGLIQPGVYRVVIESKLATLPPKFNANTVLGVEIPPRELDNRRTTTTMFRL